MLCVTLSGLEKLSQKDNRPMRPNTPLQIDERRASILSNRNVALAPLAAELQNRWAERQ